MGDVIDICDRLIRRDDADLIGRPQDWPLRPYLPLKRDGSVNAFGTLFFNRDTAEYLLIVAGIGDVMGVLRAEGAGAVTDRFRAKRYREPAAIVADGWRID